MLSSQYFFQQLHTAVLIVNHKGEVIFSNHSFLKVSGYSNSDLSDKKTNELLVDFNLGVNDWQGEVYLKTKENGDLAKWMQVNHVNDPFGHKYTVLMISDIQMSGFDPLTMLPNRYLFQHLLQKAMNQAREKDKFLGLFYIDLDRFKFINDTLGHGFGDSLLKEAARRLKECMGVNDTVARLGGDEFICLIQDVKDEIEAEQRAERIISYFREPFNINETEIYVTSSIGISLFPFDGDEMESLIANADTAMYRAKNAGRNMIEKTEMDIGAGAFENLMIANNLRKALDREEFLLYLQPQFDVKQNRFIAMEALLRWNHPDLGLISPGDFIPIAEETGLIVPIGDWVIKTACLKIKEWLSKGIPPVRIAVNLSAKQFMQNDIVEKIQLVLKETAIPPECLELEITESMMMYDIHSAAAILARFKKLGVRLSLDDFGKGYSSLSYLKEFKVDTLKIDRSFVYDIDTNPSSKALTNAITRLAHDLNMMVVAEGVETHQQLLMVKKSKCDVVQGFYYSRPLSPENADEFMNDKGVGQYA